MNHFAPLTAFLDSLTADPIIPGCDCAIARDGVIIYRHQSGYSDPDRQKPVSDTDTYWIYSATKLCTCVAALQLIEQNRLSLSDPVSRYLPEFKEMTVRNYDGSLRPASSPLLIQHLMTMTGGFDYDLTRPSLQSVLGKPDQNLTTRQFITALSREPLCFDPGAHFLYSLGHDVLGAVIEVISGMRLSDYIRTFITQPLEMKDTTFHPDESQLSRRSTQYAHLDEKGSFRVISQDNPYCFSVAYESGGAGLLSTVSDYIRLAGTLSLNGTAPNGYQLLKPETVELYSRPFLTPVQLIDFLNRSPAARGYSYGLGVQVLINDSGTTAPLGEFGWDGAAGAYVLVDPKDHVAVFYAQQVCQSRLTYQYIHPHLRDLIFLCLED